MRAHVLFAAAVLGASSAALVLAGCNPCSKESGQICTIAGTGKAALGAENKPATETDLYLVQDITAGPDGRLYIMDWNNHRIRTTQDGGTLKTIIGTGELGDAQDGDAMLVALNHPTHVTFDPQGRLILSAWHNSKVMRYDFSTKEIYRICGTGKRAFGGDEGPALNADLDLPVTTAFRSDGAMYIADQANVRIRLVDAQDVIHTVAGSGVQGFGGDGGPAKDAQFQAPVGQAASPAGKMVLDKSGNLFIADSGNNRVRKVDAETFIITTFAGVGGAAGADPASADGDGGPATEAHLARPTDLAVGPDGSLFIADTDNSCIRKVGTDGVIHTVAGVCGQEGFDGDFGDATQAKLARPFGIDVDKDGVLYIADTYNHRVRAVYP